MINTICPGGIETERLKSLVTASEYCGKSYETTLQRMRLIPKGRFGRPDELASLAEYLCCEEAAYITGRTICSDGSFTGVSDRALSSALFKKDKFSISIWNGLQWIRPRS